LCVVPPNGKSPLLKVIVPLPMAIEAIISSGVVSSDRSILFSSSTKSYLCFYEATLNCQIITSALSFFSCFNLYGHLS